MIPNYVFVSTTFILEQVIQEIDLSQGLNERLKQIVTVVYEKYALRYNMKDRNIETLISEATLYSYDRFNERCPVEPTELPAMILKIREELREQREGGTFCFRWCRWCRCFM
jgi:hypothetical protein